MKIKNKIKAKRLLNRLEGKLVLKRKPKPKMLSLGEVQALVEKSNKLSEARFKYVLDKVRDIKIPESKVERIEVIKPELRTEIVREVKELDIKELKRLEKELDTVRDFAFRQAQLGGGSMNRQIRVGGVDYLTKYTDINLIAGTNVSIAVADDNTNKRVGLTFSASGGAGVSYETPVGDVNDTNMTFTVSNTPVYINVNGLIYREGEGIFTSYVAGTITLSTPVGTGGFLSSAYAS